MSGVMTGRAAIFLCLFLGLLASPARAAFGNCADPSYRASFDERLEAVSYDCVERLRLTVPAEGGAAEVRLIHDRNAGWAAMPGIFAEFDRGLRAAAVALDQIGSFRLDDVTFLLIDGLPPRERGSEDFSDIAALAGSSGGECRVGIYLLGAGGRMENAAYVVVNELFHCVQEATLSDRQMASGSGGTGAGGDWWLEGSADWFAALALPELGPLPARIARFDSASPGTPLYEMAYEAVVFFLWLNDERGPSAVVPFLRQMADRPGAAAQRAAMARALSADEWLDFAETYLDGDIKHPHGTRLSVNPTAGESWRFRETGNVTIRLETFVIHRGWIEFECGRWRTSTDPDRYHAVRVGDGEWGGLPERIDTREAADRFRFAGMSAEASAASLALEADLDAGCEPCRGISETDACLVGAWRQSGGGPVEWMRSVMPGFEFPHAERTGGIMVLKSDGTYFTTPLSAGTTIVREDDGRVSKADGDVTVQASGRWSAADGKFNICQDTGSFQGRARLTIPGAGQHTMALPDPGSTGSLSLDYTCSAGGFRTSLMLSGFPRPMETQYSRVSVER